MHHDPINAPGFVAPIGYSDAMRAAPGHHLITLAGHVSFNEDREIIHDGDLVAQVRTVLENLKTTLRAAGGTPDHIVKLTIHVLDVEDWREKQKEIGKVWREIFGKVYPATTLLGVNALFDTGALVEIDGLAVIPDPS